MPPLNTLLAQMTRLLFYFSIEKLIGGEELENCFDYNVLAFEAFRLILVKKNCQKGERRKRSSYLQKKSRAVIDRKKTDERSSLAHNV